LLNGAIYKGQYLLGEKFKYILFVLQLAVEVVLKSEFPLILVEGLADQFYLIEGEGDLRLVDF
jgi:hypothetical protein